MLNGSQKRTGRAALTPTLGVGRDAFMLMLYSHDTYGLGHLSRTLTIARYLRASSPSISQLIVTGSPVAHSFALPAGADYIKLPSVVKVGAGEYASRSVAADYGEIWAMRQDILLSAARHLQPDALVVDHAPAGLHGEIVATLRYLKDKAPETRLILGLRDIMDEATRVRRAWAREAVYELLDDLYDLILIYGQRDIYDVVGEYGFSPRAARKARYVGYLGRQRGPRSTAEIRADLRLETDRLVVVTAGGGGDGSQLLLTMADALATRQAPPRFDCLLVGGPLMPAADRERIKAVVQNRPAVRFLDFSEDMASHIQAADVVVSMGGYNAVCEALSFDRPAIICPRVAPRKEQLLRAEALNQLGLVRMLHPADLTPGRLLADVEQLLTHRAPRAARLAMDGLPNVAAELGTALLPFRARGPRALRRQPDRREPRTDRHAGGQRCRDRDGLHE
jgi:predicted glycosyltransferase